MSWVETEQLRVEFTCSSENRNFTQNSQVFLQNQKQDRENEVSSNYLHGDDRFAFDSFAVGFENVSL